MYSRERRLDRGNDLYTFVHIGYTAPWGEDYFESEPKDFRAYLDYVGVSHSHIGIEPLAMETRYESHNDRQ